ncbi:ABC transporter permease [Psychrobacillus glaciei]|uniref:ABC transporter permease n=1 Tax=Psychrobacillus glaciei TaxID=2283160 RepID=A0A5J6SIQ3_9BACI|nr:ABC transporter permease [Psychrobacillus glaciei]QFF97846.1 ABC transporter permease [Psychrobacillus glaciei]
MFIAFMKKQFLFFLRRPQELLILLLMPFVLISILGFALGSIMDGDGGPPMKLKVAIVEHTSEQQELTDIIEQFGKITDVHNLLPITSLKEQLFNNEEVNSFIILETLSADQLDEAKKDGVYDAIIEVPEHFNLNTIQAIFIENQKKPELILYSNETKSLSANVVQSLIDSFQQQYSRTVLLGKNNLLEPMNVNIISDIQTIDKHKPVEARAYYTIGMSVMFVLFAAVKASTMAYDEKKLHLFDRILLANVSRWTYLLSIFASTLLLVFIQLSVLFGGAFLVYGVKFPTLSLFILITIMLSSVIGAIATLLTSINFRTESKNASNLFQAMFASVLSFLGGSFFQVSSISAFFNTVGNLTPNGAAMSAYLKLMQGDGLKEISSHLYVLAILTIVLLSVSILLFPRKGGVV